jgi:hypothetical protein
MEVAPFMTGPFGTILALLALSVCVVWLVFPFIAMTKLRSIREEVEKGNRYLADIAHRNSLTVEYTSRPMVRAVPVAQVVPRARVVPTARILTPGEVIAPPSVVPLKISKGGQKVGLKDTTSIKVMLKKGELSLDDHYYDAESNQWVALCCHPEFSAESGSSAENE